MKHFFVQRVFVKHPLKKKKAQTLALERLISFHCRIFQLVCTLFQLNSSLCSHTWLTFYQSHFWCWNQIGSFKAWVGVAGGFGGMPWLGALMGARFHLQALSGHYYRVGRFYNRAWSLWVWVHKGEVTFSGIMTPFMSLEGVASSSSL